MCGIRSSPTRSSRPNTPVEGKPSGLPITASASSMVSPASMAWTTACCIQKVPMRLAMKPGVSLARTTVLPSFRSQKAATLSASAASVSAEVTTSSRRM